MRIAFTRWRSGGLLNRPSPRKRLLPKKKTSSGCECVSGLADGASAMPAKWSRPVFSFRFYEGKISLNPRFPASESQISDMQDAARAMKQSIHILRANRDREVRCWWLHFILAWWHERSRCGADPWIQKRGRRQPL